MHAGSAKSLATLKISNLVSLDAARQGESRQDAKNRKDLSAHVFLLLLSAAGKCVEFAHHMETSSPPHFHDTLQMQKKSIHHTESVEQAKFCNHYHS